MATNQQIYEILIKNNQAIQSLTQIQTKVSQVSDSFSKLKGALTGLVAASVVKSAFEAANAMSDLATASNIAIESILGFKKAVKEAGGDTADIEQGIGRFAQAIDSAASGSKEAQDRFLKLGITLQDLKTLNEADLLRKTIKALGEGKGGAESMADGMAIFGKSYRSVAWGEVADSIDKTTEGAKASAESYRQAGEALQKFQSAMSKINSEIIKALAPIASAVSKILEFSDAVSYFIRTAVQIGLVIASFSLLGKAVSLLSGLVAGMIEGWAAFRGALVISGNALKNWGAISATVAEGAALGGSKLRIILGIFKELGGAALKAIPGIGALIGTLAIIGGVVWDAIKALGTFLGLISNEKDKVKESADAQKGKADAVRDVTDAYKKQKEAVEDIVKSFDKQVKKSSEQLQFETSLIGKSKEAQEAMKAQFAVAQQYQETLDKLKEGRANLTKEELKAGVGGTYDAQIARLEKLKAAALAKAKVDADANSAAINADELRKFSELQSIENSKALQTIRENILKSTMSEVERRNFELEIQAKSRATEKIASEEQRLGRKLSAEERAKYTQEALKGLKELQDESRKEYELSREFATGWQQAFNDYADAAFNAADQAKRVFSKFTQGMEDMLVNFFKTGKMGWKDFLASMVEEMLRSNIRQMMANMLPTVGGSGQSGSIIGSIWSSLTGKASGGPVGANTPYIVGERGPELFVPNSGGSIIPNGGLGGGSVVNYNISAVDAMSFKQMIARDPSFIHAVAMQGARTIPGGR